ncbi:GpE family phage tail protein [Solimicrobium silvestre]|nr:GpE family phage tail protein [Solimicrobium silvestre]
MADIAVVFHWPPAAMSEFTLSELMDWRERARVRSTTEQ